MNVNEKISYAKSQILGQKATLNTLFRAKTKQKKAIFGAISVPNSHPKSGRGWKWVGSFVKIRVSQVRRVLLFAPNLENQESRRY